MIVEQNRKAGQNAPRVVAPTQEEEEEYTCEIKIVNTCDRESSHTGSAEN